MNKKAMIFGIGVGILLTVLIAFGAYLLQRNSHRNNMADLQAALDMTADELATALDAQTTEVVIEIEAEIDDDTIMSRARELGMIFADEIEMPPESMPYEGGAADDADGDSDTGLDGETAAGLDEPADGDYVWVNIPLHANSTQISELLQDSGVVASAAAFNQFLLENGYDRIVQAGNFRLPMGGDFDVIIDIILVLR